MALFKILKGELGSGQTMESKVPTKHEGYCYFDTRDSKFYIDISNSERKVLNAQSATELDNSGTWIWGNETNTPPTANLTIGGKTTLIPAIPLATVAKTGDYSDLSGRLNARVEGTTLIIETVS